MDRLKMVDSYERSEMITEDYDMAVSNEDWEKALRLNEEHYREAIDRFLIGHHEDRIYAMEELAELSDDSWSLIKKLGQLGGKNDSN